MKKQSILEALSYSPDGSALGVVAKIANGVRYAAHPGYHSVLFTANDGTWHFQSRWQATSAEPELTTKIAQEYEQNLEQAIRNAYQSGTDCAKRLPA